MENVLVDAVLPALQETLNDEFIAAYHFPGHGGGYFSPCMRPDNLLLIVSSTTTIHTIRETYQAVLNDLRQSVDYNLMVTTEGALGRHLRLRPLFAHHLATHAQLLDGTEFLGNDVAPHPAEQVAFLAQQALMASAALAPARMAAEDRTQARRCLRQLAQLMDTNHASQNGSATELFAAIQVRLRQRLDGLPLQWRRQFIVDDAERPNLEAIYEDREFLLIVIPPLAAHLLRKIDWPALANQAPAHLTGLAVCSARQLRLVVQSERPLDYVLGCFRHLWGRNPLVNLRVTAWATFRQAARKPSDLLHELSASYVQAAGEEEVRRVIHDYQNRLLNLRLEHELLHRLHDVEHGAPQEELPRRSETNPVRIDAIIQHLNWWTDYYEEKMQEAPADRKMAPV